MQSNELIKVTVAAVLGVVLLASLAIPLITEATKTTDTLTNDGLYRMAEVELSGTDEIVITWDYTAPTVVTIDNVGYTFGSDVLPNSASRTFAFCDDYLLRVSNYDGVNYGIELWYASAQSVSANDAVNLTVTITPNSISWVKGTADPVEFTTTGDWNIINNAGDYVMKSPSETAYMLDDSYFKIAGISGVGESGGAPTMSFFCIDGTLENFTITNPNGITISDELATYTATNGYVDVYDLEKITFTTTYHGDDVNQTYTYFMVPYEIVGEKSVHFSDTEITILELIPLLLTVALVLGIIGYAIRARLS